MSLLQKIRQAFRAKTALDSPETTSEAIKAAAKVDQPISSRQPKEGKSTSIGEQSPAYPPDKIRAQLPGLSRWLELYLSIDELQEFCLLLGMDFCNLGGTTKSQKMREFVQSLHRKGRLNELFVVGQEWRPDIDWDSWEVVAEAISAQHIMPWQVSHRSDTIYDFLKFQAFLREAFTVDELIAFVKHSTAFKEFFFKLPANVSHDWISRELWDYARRRSRDALLFAELQATKPNLYEKYAPFVREA